MLRDFRGLALPLVLAAHSFGATVGFDSLADGETLTNQFASQGVAFQNAVALSAGISLNEFELPPRSFGNVISDLGGPLSIAFSTPQSAVFAYFTYLQGITLGAFDASGASLGFASSACANNLAISGAPGCSPNELIGVSNIGAITRVTILGSATGGSFALDDLTFDQTATPREVSEPSTFVLFGAALLSAPFLRRA